MRPRLFKCSLFDHAIGVSGDGDGVIIEFFSKGGGTRQRLRDAWITLLGGQRVTADIFLDADATRELSEFLSLISARKGADP